MQYEERFSKRLIQLRMQKGVSAREMSLSIGQNASYINNIETGKALPSMNGFFYICEYMKNHHFHLLLYKYHMTVKDDDRHVVYE